MNMRTVLLVTAALATAGGTAFTAKTWLTSERAGMTAAAPAKSVEKKSEEKVLVLKDSLPVGHFLKEGDFKWQAWPKEALAEGYVLKGEGGKVEDFVGTVIRAAVAAGQPVTDKVVVHPGDRGYLAAVLQPGMRAVSVPINATTGIAGFVFPGDMVDLVLTVKMRPNNADSGARPIQMSQTFLNEIRVLAIDQQTNNEEGKAKVAKTATLEVTPKQAEKVALGLELGSLSLSLRSLPRTVDRYTELAETVGALSGPPQELDRSFTMDRDIYYMVDVEKKPEIQKVHYVEVVRGTMYSQKETSDQDETQAE